MSLPIEITHEVTLPQVLKASREQWTTKDVVDEIIGFISEQTDTRFEDQLLAAIQKFKADNE
jgi:hypothetical protein